MTAIQKSRLLRLAAAALTAGILAVNALHAQSWVIGPFVRPLDAPVIEPNRFYNFTDPVTQQKILWDNLATFDPGAAIAPDGEVAILFRAEGSSAENQPAGLTSRLALAVSKDGLFFTVDGAPVLSPANHSPQKHPTANGLQSPRIVVAPDGSYLLTYTQSSPDPGTKGRVRYTIQVATSKNLRDWIQHGPAFAAPAHGSPGNTARGSDGQGAILTRLHHERLQAAKLHGKYWMYWGQKAIHLATSTDLIHWTPVLDRRTGRPLTVLSARAGHFDSGSAEAGPPPLLTRSGIVLIYNGQNSLRGTPSTKNFQDAADPGRAPSETRTPAASKDNDPVATTRQHPSEAKLPADPALGPGAYAVGEALFSAADPSRLLGRTDHPVLRPVWPYERHGQYAPGAAFAEGLVSWQGQWLLYYGAADSVIGVARATMR